ncbi:LysR family transcriptional regulator [Ostreiculturibacter nitratireducens]|uniref:LysR family transcriptional regulator n=1 Tax=Ostreiculturibacter nitratireducens TaxID=3075226 RepID=UPI0031B5E405
MESRWLEDFLSLVETRNFSRSAQARYTTQPAFSRRIKSLEEWVGAQLFDRASQPITLTAAGERFRPVAEDVLRRLYQGREDARRIGESSANTIRFAATHSLSLNFFPGWLRSIEMRSHAFNTRLDTVQFQECMQMLLRGECHFVLSYTHKTIPMHLPSELFTGKVVLKDRLVPVTLPDSAGQPIDLLPGTEDEPVHYLAYSETSAIGRAVEQLIADMKEPVYLTRVFVSHMAAVLKPMSTEGRGTAWLPESHIRKDLDEGRLVLAGDEKWFIPVDIRLIRSRDPLPVASEEFWSLIEVPEDSDWG